MPDVYTAFALIGAVLLISALASGLIERGPLSFPMIFLGLGFLIGENGLGLVSIGPHDATLEVVATLTLALVLFLDAVKLRIDEFGDDWVLPALGLGPGTLLTIAIVALGAWYLLGTTLVESLLLGAILSSTDPVVLREIVRDRRIPGSVRRALSVEAGTNDLVVLPAVLILIAVGVAETGGTGDWLTFLGRLLIVGPVIGVLIGVAGAWLMTRADERFAIRREYQALYGIGLVFAAFVAGDTIGVDGFLTAFAAGFAVTAFNFELCDCFLEYGDATAEMAMLFAFVLFGAVLSGMIGTAAFGTTMLFAVLVLGVARPLSFSLVLLPTTSSRAARAFISWFGPRGLNSMLLVLLVVQSGLTGAERLMAIVGVVVTTSVIVHGSSATPLASWYGRRVARDTVAEERESTARGLYQQSAAEAPRITAAGLAKRLREPNPPIVLDVRSRSQYERARAAIPGSVRVLPDQLGEWAREQDLSRTVVAYCT